MPTAGELAALLKAAPAERVATAVSVVAEHAAVVAGLADDRVLGDGLRERAPVTNRSAALLVAICSTVPVSRLVLKELADVMVPASVRQAEADQRAL